MASDPLHQTTDEPDPQHILPGIAMNAATSAEYLMDDATAYASDASQENLIDLLASLRIMRRRIDVALDAMGVKP